MKYLPTDLPPIPRPPRPERRRRAFSMPPQHRTSAELVTRNERPESVRTATVGRADGEMSTTFAWRYSAMLSAATRSLR
jgi:hypothetical protein